MKIISNSFYLLYFSLSFPRWKYTWLSHFVSKQQCEVIYLFRIYTTFCPKGNPNSLHFSPLIHFIHITRWSRLAWEYTTCQANFHCRIVIQILVPRILVNSGKREWLARTQWVSQQSMRNWVFLPQKRHTLAVWTVYDLSQTGLFSGIRGKIWNGYTQK